MQKSHLDFFNSTTLENKKYLLKVLEYVDIFESLFSNDSFRIRIIITITSAFIFNNSSVKHFI